MCTEVGSYLLSDLKKVETNNRGDLNKEHGDAKKLPKLISVVPCLFGI